MIFDADALAQSEISRQRCSWHSVLSGQDDDGDADDGDANGDDDASDADLKDVCLAK